MYVHSNCETLKKHIDYFRNNMKKGTLAYSLYPLIYDKICICENKKQLYGSQYYFDKETKKIFFTR